MRHDNGMVSIADLPSGIYIVRIYGADGELSLSSKLTKQEIGTDFIYAIVITSSFQTQHYA